MDPGVLCLSAPRADRNRDPIGDVAWCYTLSQRTACRSQPPRSQIWLCTPFFVSAHRVQIATQVPVMVKKQGQLCLSAPRADRNHKRVKWDKDQWLCLSAPRADRNGKCAQSTACGFVECAVSR